MTTLKTTPRPWRAAGKELLHGYGAETICVATCYQSPGKMAVLEPYHNAVYIARVVNNYEQLLKAAKSARQELTGTNWQIAQLTLAEAIHKAEEVS